jgi:biotin carboxyl carrier protein
MTRFRFQSGSKTSTVVLEPHAQGTRAVVDGQPLELEVLDEQPGLLSLRLNGKLLSFHWADDGERKWISIDGCTYILEKPTSRRTPRPGESQPEDVLRAPMPALVRSVSVSEGDLVSPGQTLLLLEAMKMEIRLQAPRLGLVVRMAARQGETVERDQILVEIDDPPQEEK